jgi:hypothetical protein
VPVATIPIVAGLLAGLEKRDAWASEADWEQGYQFAACLQECLGLDCIGKSHRETALLLAYMSGLPDRAPLADIEKILPGVAASIAEIDLSGDDDTYAIRNQIGRIATLAALLELRGQNLEADPTGQTYTTLYDLLQKLDADNTELKAYWEILLKTGAEPGYYNLFEIAGVPLTDSEEFITYPPTLGGILAKLQNIQGAALTSREGWTNERTKLKTIYDALSAPPPAGTDDPINWWQEVKDIIDLIGTGVDITTDLYDFLSRTANTAANAATTGTTGATAIGQWVTAMALALIAAQMNQAQGTRITIRNNTNALPTIETNTAALPDIELHLSAIGAHMDDLLADDSVSGKTNLYDLLQELECICKNTRKRLSIQGAPEEIQEPEELDAEPITPPATDTWCQRVQWLVDRIAFVIGRMDSVPVVTAQEIFHLHVEELDTYPNRVINLELADYANRILNSKDTLSDAVDAIDNNKAALVSSIYSATGPQTAQAGWASAVDALNLTGDEKLLVTVLVGPEVLNRLFREAIPLEPFELSFFDPDFCTSNGGGGNGGGGTTYEGIGPFQMGGGGEVSPVYGWQAWRIGRDPIIGNDPNINQNPLSTVDTWTVAEDMHGWRVIYQLLVGIPEFDIVVYDNGSEVQRIPAISAKLHSAASEITVHTTSVNIVADTDDTTVASSDRPYLDLYRPV